MTVILNYNPLDRNSTPLAVIDLTIDDKPIPDPPPLPAVTPQWTTSEDTKKIAQAISASLNDEQLATIAAAAESDISAAATKQEAIEIILDDVLKTDSNNNISLTDTVSGVKTIIDTILFDMYDTNEVSKLQYNSIVEFATIIVDTVGEIAEGKQQIYSDPERFSQLGDDRRRALSAAVAEGELEAVTQERDWAREELEGLGAPTYDPITGEPVSPFNIEKFIEEATLQFGELSEEEWDEIDDEIKAQFSPIRSQIAQEGFNNFLREEGIIGADGKIDTWAFLERMNAMFTEDGQKPTTFVDLMIGVLREAVDRSEFIVNDYSTWSSLNAFDRLEILDTVKMSENIRMIIDELEFLNNFFKEPEGGGG